MELEPNPALFLGNEDYLLLLKDLFDAIEAMEKAGKRADYC